MINCVLTAVNNELMLAREAAARLISGNKIIDTDTTASTTRYIDIVIK